MIVESGMSVVDKNPRACCFRRFYWVQSLWKHQVLYCWECKNACEIMKEYYVWYECSNELYTFCTGMNSTEFIVKNIFVDMLPGTVPDVWSVSVLWSIEGRLNEMCCEKYCIMKFCTM